MTDKKGAKKYNPKKTDTIAKLSDKFGKAKAFFLADYRGLTHQQLETLKKSLKKVEGEFVVAKNTLLNKALNIEHLTFNKETKEKIAEELKNPTAAFFAYKDEIAAIKEFANFIKTTQLPKINIGFFAGKVALGEDFQKLASLPTRDILLATLAIRLKSPIYGLHRALNWNLQRLVTVLENVKNKKPASK